MDLRPEGLRGRTGLRRRDVLRGGTRCTLPEHREKRAEAAAAAGSRESADLLAYVRQLESEAEPLAMADDEGGPVLAAVLTEHESPAVREAARAQLNASRALLRALVAA